MSRGNRKMKIAYLISTLQRTGPVNVLFGLLSKLDRSSFDPLVLTLSKEPIDSRRGEFEEDLGVPVITTYDGKSRFFSLFRIRQFIKEQNVTLIHSHGLRPDLLLSRTHLSFPRISTLHQDSHTSFPLKYGSMFGKLLANVHMESLKKLDLVVSCSKSIHDLACNYGLETAVVVNGIDTSVFIPVESQTEKEKLRRKLNLPIAEKIYISVGALIDRKRPLQLIKGFLSSKTAKRGGTLIVVGDGPLYGSCKAIAESKKVFLVGKTTDVSSYLRASDFYVSASSSEGLPISVLEALSSGLPVGLSGISQHEEILSNNCEAGVVFGLSEKEISEGFDRLAFVNWRVASSAARRVVEKFYSTTKMTEEYCSIYKKLLESEGSSDDRFAS